MTNKKFFLIFALALAALAFGACSSTPPQPENFTVDLSSPQLPAGEIETQIPRMFPLSGLKKILVTVSYFPYEDAVCLNYRSDFFTYNQFWSRDGRNTFLTALEKYNADYTARNLNWRNRRDRMSSPNRYGTVEGYLIWQMASITRRVSANMDVELGYTFSDDSPYYAVTQKLTVWDNPRSDLEEDDLASQEIVMHFTRAQAQELAALFDQDYLRSLIPPEMGGMRNLGTGIDVDEY